MLGFRERMEKIRADFAELHNRYAQMENILGMQIMCGECGGPRARCAGFRSLFSVAAARRVALALLGAPLQSRLAPGPGPVSSARRPDLLAL